MYIVTMYVRSFLMLSKLVLETKINYEMYKVTWCVLHNYDNIILVFTSISCMHAGSYLGS